MVGDAVVCKVVGADPLRPAAASRRAARRPLLGAPLLLLVRLNSRGEHLHRRRAVRVLRALVLREGLDAGRCVREPHGRLGRVDVLPACAARAHHLHLHVRLGQFRHLGRLVLRHDRNHRRRGVDAPLRLRLGDPLHAVRPALRPQRGEHSLTRHRRRRLAAASVLKRRVGQQREAPALALAVALVHAEELLGEEASLVAAHAGVQLHQCAPPRRRLLLLVDRDQQRHQRILLHAQRRLRLLQLGSGELAKLRL
mmetsp:Transcript_12448/g.39679  ORF Transcript_12448/g.39679 Transcript_12448/m.39679 type:complete len:254 (+) Transcript_12448:173-934(+)